MNASPITAAPHTFLDLLLGIYQPHIPARNKERFFAVLDDRFIPSANPDDPRDSNPHPQWVMNALDKLDALLDPYHPLPKEARKARGAIRLAAMEQLSKLFRERLRRENRKLPV